MQLMQTQLNRKLKTILQVVRDTQLAVLLWCTSPELPKNSNLKITNNSLKLLEQHSTWQEFEIPAPESRVSTLITSKQKLSLAQRFQSLPSTKKNNKSTTLTIAIPSWKGTYGFHNGGFLERKPAKCQK